MSERRRGDLPEEWYSGMGDLTEFGYEEDGIMWLTVTPETATPELALTEFAGTSEHRRRWRVAGRRELVLDVDGSRQHGEPVAVPAGDGGPQEAYWELVDPAFNYGGPGPWENLEAPRR